MDGHPENRQQRYQRTARACDACRKRKGKCKFSSNARNCDHCNDFNLDCTFLSPGLGRGIRRKRRPLMTLEGIAVPAKLPQPSEAQPRAIPTTVPLHSHNAVPTTSHEVFVASRHRSVADGDRNSGCRRLYDPLSAPVADGNEILQSRASTSASGADSNIEPSASLTADAPIVSPASLGSIKASRRDVIGPGNSTLSPEATLSCPSVSSVGSIGSSRQPSVLQDIIQDYGTHIEPYTPFLDGGVLQNGEAPDLVMYCLMLAIDMHVRDHGSSLVGLAKRMALKYLSELSIGDLREQELRSIMLLSLRATTADCGREITIFFDQVIQHVIDSVDDPVKDTTSRDAESRSFPLLACAMILSAWRRLDDHGHTSHLPHLPVPRCLSPFAQSFFELSQLLHYSLRADLSDYVNLEYNLLLWPAKLAPSLYYVDRSMSSSSSSILQILYCAVSLKFYISRLEQKDHNLEANQGMLSFLANTSLSTVTVWKGKRKELAMTWGKLFLTAVRSAMECAKFQMQRFHCEQSKGVLISYFLTLEPADLVELGNSFVMELAASLDLPPTSSLEQQQNLLRSGNYGSVFEQSDREGFLIYWMFRDIRSMSLRAITTASPADLADR